MMPGQGQDMPLVPLGDGQNDPRDPNLVHSHVNRTMPMDPNYINNQNPDFNKPIDNMPPNVYASNNFPEQSNNMNNNPNRKPMGAPQVRSIDLIF